MANDGLWDIAFSLITSGFCLFFCSCCNPVNLEKFLGSSEADFFFNYLSSVFLQPTFVWQERDCSVRPNIRFRRGEQSCCCPVLRLRFSPGVDGQLFTLFPHLSLLSQYKSIDKQGTQTFHDLEPHTQPRVLLTPNLPSSCSFYLPSVRNGARHPGGTQTVLHLPTSCPLHFFFYHFLKILTKLSCSCVSCLLT